MSLTSQCHFLKGFYCFSFSFYAIFCPPFVPLRRFLVKTYIDNQWITFYNTFCIGKFAPFADLKGGTYITNGGGLYIIASVGIRYALNDKQGLSLSLGYTNEKLEFEVFDGFIDHGRMDYTRDKKQYNTEAIAIKLGFDF